MIEMLTIFPQGQGWLLDSQVNLAHTEGQDALLDISVCARKGCLPLEAETRQFLYVLLRFMPSACHVATYPLRVKFPLL